MMPSSNNRTGGTSIIFSSFIVALILSILPLPFWLEVMRPEFVPMLLIYWCLALPHRVGVGVAWILGLFVDVTEGVLLGQNALIMSVIAILVLKLHQRIRLYPLWQQALSVFMIIAFSQMISLWIQGIVGQAPRTWMYWISPLTSMLFWPWFYLIMRNLRRHFGVS